MDIKLNFSIPVTLFDFKESNNPLYSFAKLKIFYVGQTGDRRLFTKKFSDGLIKTLPYVPVVGYYNEEKEDFEGHKPDIQHIYGMVPEDTGVEYIKEDGKEYAVCDVILYTGRKDKTGQIAQKIVGKQHSLELNPEDIEYKVNKDGNGKIKNIEFTKGSLLGLSILGDDENPAFSGSGFFSKDTQLMQILEGFREQFEEFTKQNKRGEQMEFDTNSLEATEEEVVVEENFSEEETVVEENFNEDESTVIESDLQPEIVEENNDESSFSTEEEETNTNEDEEDQSSKFDEKTKEIFDNFMRVTVDEMRDSVLGQFYTEFPDTYVIQWSTVDNLIVYVDINDYSYYRVSYEMDQETEILTFGEIVAVKMRFLTDTEIDSLWPGEDGGDGDFVNVDGEDLEDMGTQTEDSEEISSNDNEDDTFNEQEEGKEENSQSEEQLVTAALNSSEREELEAFRREKKLNLINSFEDDLSGKFLTELQEQVDNYSFDELEVILSKEFTKETRQNKTSKTNAFIYNPTTSKVETEADIAKRLVNRYK